MPVQFKDHIDAGGNRIENLADPTADQHAATRAYVLSQIAGAGGYTDENARDAIAAALVAGNNIDITVNDGADTITIDVEALTSADISDFLTAVRAGISVTDTATLDLSYSGGAISGAVLDSPTVNGATPAQLRDRSTHTGSQASSTITQATARILGRVTASSGATEELTAAQVKTLLAIVASDISDFSTAADARINAVVTGAFINALTIDADTLGGSSKAQIIADAIAGVVDAAPATLDTLNELAAALGDDPNFATTVTNAIAAKTGKYAATVGGSTSIAVNHNLGTRDVVVTVYDAASFDQVLCDVVMTNTNTCTLGFASAPAAESLRVVVIG